MKFSKKRELREEVSKAFSQKCLNDQFDNSELIKKIVKLKHDRAILLGYKNYADYTLEERMAGSADKVYELLDGLYDQCFPVASNEIAELKTFAEAEDGLEDFMPWDYAYYSEKLKKMLFEFNEEDLRPYLRSENVIEGLFEVANRLYGLKFEKEENIEHFLRFAEVVFTAYSDRVSYWCTHNECGPFATMGWGLGVFPPGKNSLKLVQLIVSS